MLAAFCAAQDELISAHGSPAGFPVGVGVVVTVVEVLLAVTLVAELEAAVGAIQAQALDKRAAVSPFWFFLQASEA